MRREGWLLMAMAIWPIAAWAQTSAVTLTVDEAVALAVRGSRTITMAALEEARAREEVAAARTRRLPSFSVETQVSRLLRPVEITFPAGAFGTFADTGPVPATDTAITTPARIGVLVNASAAQPLTGVWRAQVGIRAKETSLAVASEQTRDARRLVARDVRRTYYAVLQATRALDAADASARLLSELDAVVADRVTERVALRSDHLEVAARRARLDQLILEQRHAIAAGTERLNHLLGRPPASPLSLVPIAEMAPPPVPETDDAVEARPDVRQARLRVRLAELAARDAVVDRWPSADLALQWIAPMNIDGAPRNIATLALRVSWQPFDWGRRARERAARDLEARRADAAAIETASAAALDIASARRAVEAAQVAMRAAVAARTTAEETARVRTAQYQVRAVLLADVLDAHATLSDRAARADQALLALLDARATLEFAVGEDLP